MKHLSRNGGHEHPFSNYKFIMVKGFYMLLTCVWKKEEIRDMKILCTTTLIDSMYFLTSGIIWIDFLYSLDISFILLLSTGFNPLQIYEIPYSLNISFILLLSTGCIFSLMSVPQNDPLMQVETTCGSLLYELKVLTLGCIADSFGLFISMFHVCCHFLITS